jgi:hypothetical protein
MKNRTAVAGILILVSLVFAATATPAAGPEDAARLHGDYESLLKQYVVGLGVDYAAWKADAGDAAALGHYVDELAALDPADWPRADGLAYWINMYNAVTLRLILDHYPLDGIKEIGGFMKKSPWKRKLVTVAERKLTLNDIENDIIRPTYRDPRIHFALNCASIGCPPLGAEAYLPDALSAQLDAACRLALNRERWVRVEGDEINLTKLFSWYREDFEADGGSIRAFVDRYREVELPPDSRDFEFMPYDWSLNSAEGK